MLTNEVIGRHRGYPRKDLLIKYSKSHDAGTLWDGTLPSMGQMKIKFL